MPFRNDINELRRAAIKTQLNKDKIYAKEDIYKKMERFGNLYFYLFILLKNNCVGLTRGWQFSSFKSRFCDFVDIFHEEGNNYKLKVLVLFFFT